MDRIASGQKLVALPRAVNGRAPDHVADRVDRPGDEVQQRDADQPGPEQCGDRTPPRHADQSAQHRRGEQAHQGPERELAADPGDITVGHQVRSEPIGVRLVPAEPRPTQDRLADTAIVLGWVAVDWVARGPARVDAGTQVVVVMFVRRAPGRGVSNEIVDRAPFWDGRLARRTLISNM